MQEPRRFKIAQATPRPPCITARSCRSVPRPTLPWAVPVPHPPAAWAAVAMMSCGLASCAPSYGRRGLRTVADEHGRARQWAAGLGAAPSRSGQRCSRGAACQAGGRCRSASCRRRARYRAVPFAGSVPLATSHGTRSRRAAAAPPRARCANAGARWWGDKAVGVMGVLGCAGLARACARARCRSHGRRKGRTDASMACVRARAT